MAKFFEQLTKGRLFGHPIHSILIHFPSALFPMSLVFDISGLWFQSACFACAAFYSLAAGVVLGFLASMMGLIDYLKLPSSHSAWNKASLHGLLSITWLTVFSIELGLRLKQFPLVRPATTLELGLSIAAVVGVIFSNFLGGDLIFKHKIGIDNQSVF